MLRSARTRRRLHQGNDDAECVGAFVSAVDQALTSLRGRTRISGRTVVAMFASLEAAVDPVADAAVEPLVQQAVDDAARQAIFPTAELADRLLDLRSAATTGATPAGALVGGSR
jgi:hypothetical protein